MNPIKQFQITGMTISGFKSYQEPTELTFGPMTTVTGGNGRGKSSIADAIAFVVTGLPFFGERGIDRLHNEINPDVSISMRFLDETGKEHELTRLRQKNNMTIVYDGVPIRQLMLTDLFGERDVFLSILNPLYFIEELGGDGKNLLERYLPPISHEEILAELNDPVRAILKDQDMLSPEIFLKRKREEIRELDKQIIYLSGQKDQSAAQGQDRVEKAAELARRKERLQAELEQLTEKQFSGMDVEAMREQLVELSAQYDEVARDAGETDAADGALRSLREKIARRQGEQYQSKYAQALAEAQASVKALGEQYKKRMKLCQGLTPGAVCPTCFRPVTVESLPQMQAELKKSIASIVEAGRKGQEQVKELEALDQKSAAVFEQYKADDLKKWEAEAAELEAAQRAAAGGAAEAAGGLRMQIQTLTTELEYGQLEQAEYDRMKECREELRECEAQIAALNAMAEKEPVDFDRQIADAQRQIAELKGLINCAALYVSKRAELLFSHLKMNRVEIALYDVVKSTGEVKDAFKFNYNGRRYDRLSLSEKIRAGMEVSELMKRLTGRNYPVFVDNMESLDDLGSLRPTGQVIMAKCVHGAPLMVQPIRQTAERKAA